MLTDMVERALVTEFVRALVAAAISDREDIEDMAGLDAWANAEVTEAKLRPMMEGEIVTSHPGTEDGRWQCAYEFTAPGHDQAGHRYQWMLLGWQPGAIIDADAPVPAQDSDIDIATRITGSALPPSDPPGNFQLLDLLPSPDLRVTDCSFALTSSPSPSQRRFAEMTRLPLISADGGRMVNLATVLRVIFRRALVHTSDMRLLPAGGISWSSSELALVGGAEARLPEFFLRLKNGDPTERARYQRIKELFTEFTQGRGCEVRLMQVQQAAQDGQPGSPAQVPAVWVTVNASDTPEPLAPEVPIEFAGAGAWEAFVLASVLSEPSASVVVLDEPAVALHPSLQRQLGAHLLSAPAQFLVITHSAELLPLAAVADVKLVRLDRDDKSATRAWPVDEKCRGKMARKLAAKGNERLPFAWRAILCEGQDDVEALMTLSERMGIDLRRRNIAVTDCGGRDNQPDYVWFCTELGLKYLAVMDADSATPAALAKAQAVRDAVTSRRGGELAEFPVSLEATFGVTKQTPSQVPGAIRALPFVGDIPDPAQAPSEVVALAEAIRRLTR
jgi:Overcoming lysogenization defect protein-like, TOPRIM domain/AAA domain, putative AbiEii toxin, Type IV TA system